MIAQIVGIAVVAATFAWVLIYMGVVWDVTNKAIYNWHSLCMVLGMIFFYGNCESILVKVFCDFKLFSAHDQQFCCSGLSRARESLA